MKNIWKLLLLLVIVASGCKDNWDNFYGEEEDERMAGAKETILEALKLEPEKYSKFIQLLEETGFDKALNSERILTVWAPTNQYITGEEMGLDSIDKRRFVQNHINQLALYKTKLATKNDIETLAGKYVQISGYGDNFTVEKIKVTSLDHACKNGVFHEIAGVLTPLKNVMEYLLEAGPEYSIYRDSLLAYNDTVFRPDLSFPLGVDDVGQTIYDSVFDITNKLLGRIDFADERQSVTLLLASNAVIEDMLTDLHGYLGDLGIAMTHKDTLECFSFLMKGSYFDFSISNFYGIKRIYSAGGKEIRPDKQLLSTNYDQCSNGLVYQFEKMYIPRGPLMRKVNYVTVDMFLLPEEQWKNYYQLSYGGTINNIENDGDNNCIFVDGNAPDRKFINVKTKKGEWLELSLLQKNIKAQIEPVKLIPGKYRLSGWFYGYQGANIKLYFNGTPLIWYKDKSTTFPTGTYPEFDYNKGLLKLCDTVYVTPAIGSDVLRLEAVGAGSKAENIRVKEFQFEPVGDNY